MTLNVWDSVPERRCIEALRRLTEPKHFYQGHLRQGPANEVRLIRASLTKRGAALPEEFKTMPPHWARGVKQP